MDGGTRDVVSREAVIESVKSVDEKFHRVRLLPS